MYILHFVYPLSVNGYWDCFLLLPIVNDAAMSMSVESESSYKIS